MTWNPNDGGTLREDHRPPDRRQERQARRRGRLRQVQGQGLRPRPGRRRRRAATARPSGACTPARCRWQFTDKNPWGTNYNYDNADFQKTMGWMRQPDRQGLHALDRGRHRAELRRPLRRRQVRHDHQRRLGDSARCTATRASRPAPRRPRSARAASASSMYNGLADSIWVGSKNKPAAAKWVEFLGSADCQDIVGSKARRVPGRQDLDREGRRRVQGQGHRRRAPSSTRSRTGTTFLFPITDHASEITGIMTARNGRGVHRQVAAVVADRRQQPGERPVRLKTPKHTLTTDAPDPQGPAPR